MERVGPKPVHRGGEQQYPRSEHSVQLTVSASGTVKAFFQTEVAANTNAARQQRQSLSPERVTKKMGSSAHDTVMIGARFFNTKTNPFITLVAPRLKLS